MASKGREMMELAKLLIAIILDWLKIISFYFEVFINLENEKLNRARFPHWLACLATDFNTYTARSMTAYGSAIDGTASARSCVRSMFRVYVYVLRACLCMERGQTSRPRLKKTRQSRANPSGFLHSADASLVFPYRSVEKNYFSFRQHLSFWTRRFPPLPSSVLVPPPLPMFHFDLGRNLQAPPRTNRYSMEFKPRRKHSRDAVTTCVDTYAW